MTLRQQRLVMGNEKVQKAQEVMSQMQHMDLDYDCASDILDCKEQGFGTPKFTWYVKVLRVKDGQWIGMEVPGSGLHELLEYVNGKMIAKNSGDDLKCIIRMTIEYPKQ